MVTNEQLCKRWMATSYHIRREWQGFTLSNVCESRNVMFAFGVYVHMKHRCFRCTRMFRVQAKSVAKPTYMSYKSPFSPFATDIIICYYRYWEHSQHTPQQYHARSINEMYSPRHFRQLLWCSSIENNWNNTFGWPFRSNNEKNGTNRQKLNEINWIEKSTTTEVWADKSERKSQR